MHRWRLTPGPVGASESAGKTLLGLAKGRLHASLVFIRIIECSAALAECTTWRDLKTACQWDDDDMHKDWQKEADDVWCLRFARMGTWTMIIDISNGSKNGWSRRDSLKLLDEMLVGFWELQSHVGLLCRALWGMGEEWPEMPTCWWDSKRPMRDGYLHLREATVLYNCLVVNNSTR